MNCSDSRTKELNSMSTMASSPASSVPTEIENLPLHDSKKVWEEKNDETEESSDKPKLSETVRLMLYGAKEEGKRSRQSEKVNFIVEDTGPDIYEPSSCYVTPRYDTSKLPEVFKHLPVFVQPEQSVDDLKTKLLRQFMGKLVNDEQFQQLSAYCSIDNLKDGSEMQMTHSYPQNATENDGAEISQGEIFETTQLATLKKLKRRIDVDKHNYFVKRLKYRGMRFINTVCEGPERSLSDKMLVPGKDILYRVRYYKPFDYNPITKNRSCNRNPVFICDLWLLGRHKLNELRDSVVCANDLGLRIDVSDRRNSTHLSTCKDLFPSGFVFINKTFYNDRRPGCIDYSAQLIEWAEKKGVGNFTSKDMCEVTLDSVPIRLGFPEVYVHQGNCEHLFTFSEVRLVGNDDELNPAMYPRHSLAAVNHAVYCTTCAAFIAKWIVIECERVPFDPAFFCEVCLNQYLYKDGKKVCDFKVYPFKSNEVESVNI